ncbi:MAG: hypothetical protein EPN47_19455 [Acidobacteria bacterium]|nr:MAG: hypothetical protein EPN47_19455 [Acidobacteriota bacterium]
MAEVSDYYSGDLAAALSGELAWIEGQINANVSPFAGIALTTETSAPFVEGAVDAVKNSFSSLAQTSVPNIVLDPIAGLTSDGQAGPDGFPVNYSPIPLLSGNLLINLFTLGTASNVNGRVLNLAQPASSYRVDVYSFTDSFHYQGSATIASGGTWTQPFVQPGTVIAFLMDAGAPQPAAGSSTPSVAGWIAHSNTGVGKKLKDYFARVTVKTYLESVVEDNIPIIVQDSTHARFGTSLAIGSGTLVAHVFYNDPSLGPVDLYSTLQSPAAYPDLPREVEVPPSDPDFFTAAQLTSSNLPAVQNRCWIYSAALAIISFSVGGLWDAAARIITQLNALLESSGYLPAIILEDAQDGTTSRWSLQSGAGSVANALDTAEPPSESGGSRVIFFTATSAPASWIFTGVGLPDVIDSLIEWRFKTNVNFKFTVGLASSGGRVTSFRLVSSGTAGYDAVTKTVTAVLPLRLNAWQTYLADLNARIGQYMSGETVTSITSFAVELESTGILSLDDLSAGAPKPAGSLSVSYDVYNGQADQATIRAGALAWVAYAYGTYMERTGDYERAATGLESMLDLLFFLQSAATDARQNLITAGWGIYQDPGYQFVPGQISSVYTDDNFVCWFAFDKAARVLPAAAQTLLAEGLITQAESAQISAAAGNASTKASQIRSAILNQMWIPASGNVNGHFARGASSSGLDTSLALGSASSWAALFCHEIGDDARAVECLEFAFETFFLRNQQIVASAVANSYNQAYLQLTPFDGFKPCADSTGGYSGSPMSVSMEGTMAILAGLLRLSDNTALETYFSANYAGGLPSFIGRLVESMNIVARGTGSDGLLAYSLAARALPWEIAVRKTVSSTAWFWLTALRNDILLSSSSADLGRHPCLKVPQGVHQSIQQLQGQSSIGALEIDAIDSNGFMTALASRGKLVGRRLVLSVGYPGMNSSDFVTVATQEIEGIEVLPSGGGYRLDCHDLNRYAKSQIFTVGDDGAAVSNQHPRRLLANPMDLVLMVMQNELGLGQSSLVDPAAWKFYDPAKWDSTNTTNPTLITPNPYLEVDQVLFYRNGIFAGYLFDFEFKQPVEAKQFLEFEIFHPLGGYAVILADGRMSPRFFVPPYSFAGLASLNERNITAIPGVKPEPLINQVTFRMDYDGSGFQTELLFLSSPSLQQFGLAGEDIIESKGMKLERGGASLAGITANRIFHRYGGIDPVSGLPRGGAPALSVTSQFMNLTIEAGDFVYFSHPLLPNLEAGTRGVYNRIMEVVGKQPNYTQGNMAYQLLDTGWMGGKVLSRIAPQGTPAWSAASSAERERYMFLSQESNGNYSDGTRGKTVF